MQLHKLNKKGFFLPAFIILTIFVLVTLASVINQSALKKDDLIGIQAVTISKLDDESTKILFYLDQATKISTDEALQTLAKNAGYSEGRCETTKDLIDKDSYPIINTCPVLNPEEEFKTQLKKDLKEYLKIYNSTYTTMDYKKIFNIDIYQKLDLIPETVSPEIGDFYNYAYTKKVKESNILNIEKLSNNLIITLTDLDLPIENSPQSIMTIKPKTKTITPDLSVYKDIYSLIKSNCINKEFDECKSNINRIFTNAIITKSNDLIKIQLESNIGTIKLAFNPKQQIPEVQNINKNIV